MKHARSMAARGAVWECLGCEDIYQCIAGQCENVSSLHALARVCRATYACWTGAYASVLRKRFVTSELRIRADEYAAHRTARQTRAIDALCATLDGRHAEAVRTFVAGVARPDMGPTVLDLVEFNLFHDDDQAVIDATLFEKVRIACEPLTFVSHVRRASRRE